MKIRWLWALLTLGIFVSLWAVPVGHRSAAAAGASVGPVRATSQEDDSTSAEAFVGKRFAVKEGTIFHELAVEEFSASQVLLFDDYPSIYEAVLSGKADAALRGYQSAQAASFEERYADLTILQLTGERWAMPLGAISLDQQLIDDFNTIIDQLQDSGVLARMKARWFNGFDPAHPPTMPDLPVTGDNGKYVVAVSSDTIPFAFRGDHGRHVGFDIELAVRFAAEQGRTIEFEDMAFAAVLPAVISGRADFGISDIVRTEERAEQVLFTETYFVDDIALLYRGDAAAAVADPATAADEGGSGGFVNWIRDGIERNLIQDGRWRMIVSGLGVTLLISLVAQVLGTAFGCGLCFVLLRHNRLAQRLGRLFCTLVSGTPDLVLLMVIYYVVFGRSTISNVIVAIIAFTILRSVIVAETMKSAIETVDPTEIEAADSLGFSPFRTFTTVTLPQAVHHALPGYLADFVELVKGTAVVGFIAIMDLTRAGDVIRSNTYDAYFPILTVAVIYILVTTLLVFIFRRIVQRINTGAFA